MRSVFTCQMENYRNSIRDIEFVIRARKVTAGKYKYILDEEDIDENVRQLASFALQQLNNKLSHLEMDLANVKRSKNDSEMKRVESLVDSPEVIAEAGRRFTNLEFEQAVQIRLKKMIDVPKPQNESAAVKS